MPNDTTQIQLIEDKIDKLAATNHSLTEQVKGLTEKSHINRSNFLEF